MKRGYINLWRCIWDNWVWNDPDPKKLKWWVDMIMLANHSAAQVRIKGRTYDCGVGQCIMSLSSWAARWRTSKVTVDRFLRKLEAERQIIRDPLRYATRITICNYEIYQQPRNAKRNAKRDAKRTQTNINNTFNKENCVKEIQTQIPLEERRQDFINSMTPYQDQYDSETLNRFFRYWTEESTSGKMRFEEQRFWNVSTRLRQWNDNPLK